ncbi:EamA/RhaT family transporter [Psychrobacter sp. Ps7]|uniref:EamA/RhaT family transporter n=1 Tax=Psychrobacter sp. Ps7 TaxID=2790961 RepID=UPI001EE010C1|nr:EamA/RhaT family transporter [Psychrobacter sp. Ps7]MCG3872368.1 EamA/RhaT family transporter [Psychrobacter sp. Ps7]
MIYLTIAVLCSVAVSVLLKVLRQKNIDIRQTIVAGYPVAFLLTWFLLKPDVSGLGTLGSAWGIIIALGILLPAVFIVLGRAIESVGMVATDAAQRLSLIIPIVAAFLLFGEVLTSTRIFGLLLGFLALGALIYRPQQGQISRQAKHTPVWLFGVWAGYGIIDILFKQVAKQGTAFPLTLFVSFGLAGLLLFIYLLITRVRWQGNALAAGLLLGALNMGNIYAYVRAHQLLSESPSIVFTGMNVGVIAVATLIGVGVFKESLNRINVLGLLLAICCVAVLFLA